MMFKALLLLAALGVTASAPANGPVKFVRVRPIRYEFDPKPYDNQDPEYCDPFNGACDARFTIEYTWNSTWTNPGVTMKRVIPEVNNQNVVLFNGEDQLIPGPFLANAPISVLIRAVDLDSFDQTLAVGAFAFDYRIPTGPSPASFQTRTYGPSVEGMWRATFDIEFEAVF